MVTGLFDLIADFGEVLSVAIQWLLVVPLAFLMYAFVWAALVSGFGPVGTLLFIAFLLYIHQRY